MRSRPGYKTTEVGEIPEEWEMVRLGKVADLSGGSTPSTSNPEYWNGDIPFVTPTDVTALRGRNTLRRTEKSITRRGLKAISGKVLSPGTVLVTTRATIGHCCINNMPVVTNQGFANLRQKEELDNLYALYLIRSYKRKLEQLSSGSTYREVSKRSLRRMFVPLPSKAEQRRIASILSTVDDAIQKTDEIIAKSRQLKKGLMQQLLTKGFGHTQFKETEIGEIPEEWEVLRLRKAAAEAKLGFASGKRDQNGVIQLRMNSIGIDGWVARDTYVKVPTPDDVDGYLLQPEDVLLTNTSGSSKLIGKTALYRGEFPKATYSNHITRIRARKDVVLPGWIFYVLFRRWDIGVLRSLSVTQAGGQKTIRREDLTSMRIPVPSMEEQQRIIDVLSSIDTKLALEEPERAYLNRAKKGLMQVLLTGKVRVKVT